MHRDRQAARPVTLLDGIIAGLTLALIAWWAIGYTSKGGDESYDTRATALLLILTGVLMLALGGVADAVHA